MNPRSTSQAQRCAVRTSRERQVSIWTAVVLSVVLGFALGTWPAWADEGGRDPNQPPPPPPPNIVKVGYPFDSPTFPGPTDPNETQLPPQVKPPQVQKIGPLVRWLDPNDPNDGEWGVFGANKTVELWFHVYNTIDRGQKKRITIRADIRTNDPARNRPGAVSRTPGRPDSFKEPPEHQPSKPPSQQPVDPNDPNGPQTWTWEFEIKPQPKVEDVKITLKTGRNTDDFITIDNVKIETECTPKDKPQSKTNAPPAQKDKSQSHYTFFPDYLDPYWYPPRENLSVLPSWYEGTEWWRGGSFLPDWMPAVTDHIGVVGLPGGFAANGLLAVRLDDQPEPAGVEYVAYQFDVYTGGGMLWWEPVMPPECVVQNLVEAIDELENGWQRVALEFEVTPPPAWQELHWYMATDAGRSGPVAIDNLVMSGSTWWSDFWYDGFDYYDAGTGLHGQYGWQGWDNDPTLDAVVTDAQAGSPFHALEIAGGADLLQPFADFNWGRYALTAWQYVPADFVSGCDPYGHCGSYLVLLNTYADGGPYHWSVQLHADSLTQMLIRDQDQPVAAPLVTDRWVKIEVLIDLNADLYRVYYDGQQLGTAASWTAGVFGDGGGVLNIGALDLVANNSSPLYYDDLHLRLLEPGDLNCDGVVSFGDINPFVLVLTNPDLWQATNPNCPLLNGDINADGAVDFRDINPFIALLTAP